jgi:hypothetical protein
MFLVMISSCYCTCTKISAYNHRKRFPPEPLLHKSDLPRVLEESNCGGAPSSANQSDRKGASFTATPTHIPMEFLIDELYTPYILRSERWFYVLHHVLYIGHHGVHRDEQ